MDGYSTIALVDRVMYLKSTRILSGVETRDLQHIALACREFRADPGDVIARQGDPGDCVYIIATGRVRILRLEGTTERELAIRGEGDVLGEMAIISREPRGATMVAETAVTALVLERRTFESILKSRAEVSLAVMRVLCRRLVESESHRSA